MKINKGRTYVMSELTVDADIDMNSFGFTECGNITLVKNAGIQMLAALPADGDWCGHTVLGTAGENLALSDVVYLKSDGKLWKANATDTSKMPAKAMATAVILAGAEGVFLLDGFLRRDAWTMTVGAVLYVHTVVGSINPTPPATSGNQVQRVAIAVTADIVNFRPSKDVIEVT